MKRRFNRLSSVTLAVVACTALLLPGARVCAAESQLLHGHVPAAVADLKPTGRLEGTNHLNLAIGLPLRNKAGLSKLLKDIYDPKSPKYHQYLSVEQFTESFGPTKADYEAVRAFAKANGLVETQTHPNRMLVDVDASVANIEKAFHITLHTYKHPLENRQFYAPNTEPKLDLAVPVLHISGLDNFMVPHPASLKKTSLTKSAFKSPASGSAPDGSSYLGKDLRAAYVPGVALTGTGQTVGLLEFDAGYVQSDITAYETLAGLPNVPIIPVLLDGYNGGIGSVDGNGEVSLDIEMAIGMAPGLTQVIVYEGDVTDDILNRMATDNTAKQIGASWSYPIDANSEQIYQEYGTQGQSFFNASGDADAYLVGGVYPPSDDPNITIVGGTTLSTTGPGGAWTSETVWNWGYDPPGKIPGDEYVGSSGGISTNYSIPSWQQGISMSANGGSTTMRNLPDVALTADNIWVIYDNGQTGSFGGTSAATPLWAGFTALVNQQALANGKATMGFINPAIYAICKGASYTSCFHDITTGNNTWPSSPTNFFAVTGYDLCTGWGTPNGANLINALAPLTTPVLAVVTNIISGGNGSGIIDPDGCNNLSIILTNEGGATATGITATLYSTTAGVIVAHTNSAYPNMAPSNSAPNQTLFVLSIEPTFVCGTPVNLTMVVQSAQVVQTNYITLPSGIVGPPDVIASTTAISIPNTNLVPINSPIEVSGLQAVGKVTVSVFLSAQNDAGLTLQLISPNGTTVILSQNNGGTAQDTQNYGVFCQQSLETTFDDTAAISITDPVNAVPPYVGSYQPQEPLSVYNLMSGTNLNGTWNLQVLDEFPGDTATLECWSLNISPEICPDGGGQCPGAALSLTMTASPNPVFVDSNLVYTMTVSNAGPGEAYGTLITQTLPAGAGFVGTSNYPVTPSLNGSTLNLLVGSLPVYSSATVSVITTNTIPGLITSTASVGSQETNLNPGGSVASATVLVSEQTADLAVSMTAFPASVSQDALLTYTIDVTNNGPFPAGSASLNVNLPVGVNIISATTSQGALLYNDSFVALGSIGRGTNVVVTIVISPTNTGNITASAVVSLAPPEVDPNSLNNSASVSTTVGPAADLSVTAVAIPSPVIDGSNLSYIVLISNGGPSAATSVAASQSLPTGVTNFVSSSSSNLTGTLAGNYINMTIGNLANGASVLFTNVITTPGPGVTSNLVSTITVTGQPADPNPNNNSVTLQTLEEPPTVTIVGTGVEVLSGSSNGAVSPTGTYVVEFFLQNVGNITATNVTATLLSGNGVTLPIPSGPQSYGNLLPDTNATGNNYTFTANSTNGGTILAILQVQTNGANLCMVTNKFLMPVAQTFWNTNSISVPNQEFTPEPDDGPANPYPSAIVVSNVSGDISDVTVTVSNLFHTYPNDIGMLLVGPTGENCILMSAVADYSTMSVPATITFDQNASLMLPAEGPIVSGTYQPANYNPTNYFPAPAPAGSYTTNLAVFGSVPANGTWSLYIYDDSPGDAGVISNGWGLSFTTITPVNQVANLAADISGPSQAFLGGNITYIWTVTNNGPNSATNVFATNVLSSGLMAVTNLVPSSVIVSQNGPTNIYNLGNLLVGGGAIITNVVTAISNGPQTNTVSVGSSVLNGNPGAATASFVTTVSPPPSDLILALSATPNPVVVTSNLTYTLYITNNGPSNAYNVVGLFALSSLQLGSSNTSQGSCVSNNGYLQCTLGTIPSGSNVQVTLIASNLVTGFVTNVWSVATTSSNINMADNSISGIITVINPAPVITNGPVTLLFQGSPPYNGAINPNQTNTVSLPLTNIGSGPTTNLEVTLLATSGITPVTNALTPSTSNNYGALTIGATASQSFSFVGSGSPGSIITAEWALRDTNNNNNFAPISYNFMIPLTQTFNNSGEIIIPDSGPGTPYPSIIQTTNWQSNLLVSKVTATLNGFTHSFPHDVEAVLVNPNGQELVLMEHTGTFYSVSGLELTFDDAATQNLPFTNSLVSGTFLATEYTNANGSFDTFPGLAPIPPANTNLAIFNGMSPNGTWSLYVYDDTPGNDGDIANGWSLTLTAVSTVNPAALLDVSTIESPPSPGAGTNVYYLVTINNLGPNPATGVVLTDVTTGAGVGTTTSNLGAIPANGSTNVTIEISSVVGGIITNTAVVTSTSANLNLPGSTNVTITSVSGPAAGVGGSPGGSTPVAGNKPTLAAATLPGGLLQLSVNGTPGQYYVVQSSSNLTTWTPLTTNNGSNSFLTNMYILTNAPQRFYRVIKLPQ